MTKARDGDRREEKRRKGNRAADEEERKACRLWALLLSWWAVILVRREGTAGEEMMKAERRKGDMSKRRTSRRRGKVERCWSGLGGVMVSALPLCLVLSRKREKFKFVKYEARQRTSPGQRTRRAASNKRARWRTLRSWVSAVTKHGATFSHFPLLGPPPDLVLRTPVLPLDFWST